jgi:hypothetical protein
VERRDRSSAAVRGSRTLAAYLLGLSGLIGLGVRSWNAFFAIVALSVVVGLAFRWAAKHGRVGVRFLRWAVCIHFALISITGLIFGPLVITPALAVVTAASYAIVLRSSRHLRVWVVAMAVLSVFLPYAAQRLGIFPPAYAFEDGTIRILPVMVEFPRARTELFLLLVTAVQLVLPLPLIFRGVDALLRAERQNFAQAWRLKHLVPSSTTRSE